MYLRDHWTQELSQFVFELLERENPYAAEFCQGRPLSFSLVPRMSYGLTAGQQLLRAFVEIVVDGGIFNVSAIAGDVLVPDMISPKGKMQRITMADL